MTTTKDTDADNTTEQAADDTAITETRNTDGDSATENADTGESGEKPQGKREIREARYRTELRAAEAERDQLRDQLVAVQRQLIEDRANAKGVKPAALWATTQHADLLADTGDVDLTKVDAAVVNAAETLGIRNPLVIEAEGQHPGTRPGKEFAAAFTPKTN